MAQQVVTELVINADTSGADSFTQAMNGAEQAANNGVASLTGMNVGLVALGTGAVAALVGVKQLLDYVASANKDLADMATTAKQVGLTLTDFQGVRFGGQIAGLSTDQINTGLEKSASLLNDASRNSNSLSKELDANGLSVKNANGQLISQNQLLGIAANLVQNAKNPGDELAIAQMLGFTKEWIPLLEQGGTAMSGLSAEAKAAGAVIDDETIQKATDFDTAWRASSVTWSANMKAAVADMLPVIDDLIQRASKFAKSFSAKDIDAAANSQLNGLADTAGVPDEAVIHIDPDGLTEATKTFLESPVFSTDTWINFGKALQFGFQVMSPDAASETIPGFAATRITEPTYPTEAQMNAAFNKASPDADPGSRSHPLPGLSASDYATGNTIIPPKDTGTDAVDKAIDSLQKHTLATEADAQAVGLGDAALAAFRADAAETAAVLKNGGAETDAQVDKFSDLRDAASAAADALAKAKVASTISVGQQTSFLSSSDVAIATQLKGIYGNDIPAALASTEAASLRVNAAFKEVSSGIESGMVTGFTDMATGAKTASASFAEMGTAIIKAIDQMIIKIAIVQPLMQALQAGANSLGIGNVGGLLGGSGGAGASLGSMGITYGTAGTSGSNLFGPVAPSAHGNVFSGGNIMAFAQGGVIDSPSMAPMALMGEAGPEAIVPLKRGSDGNLGIASSGGGGSSSPNIIINNHTDAQPQVSTNSNGDVTVTLKKMIDNSVGDSLSSGTGMRVLSKQYGVKQFAGQ